MESSTNTGPEVILLVKYKQFFIPADAAAYRALTVLKMPATRIHEDLIPIIKDAAVRHGYELRGKRWTAVTAKAEKKLSDFWTGLHENCVVEFRSRQWVFSTNKPAAYTKARAALPKLEAAIRDFLNRWGFKGEFIPSESRERLKLVVTFRMDIQRMPEVVMRKDVAAIEPTTLTFGFNRIHVRVDGKYWNWTLEQATGSTWTERFASRCLINEVGDPSTFVKALIEVNARR